MDVTRPDDFPARICCGDPAAAEILRREGGATPMHWTLWLLPLFLVFVVPRNKK